MNGIDDISLSVANRPIVHVRAILAGDQIRLAGASDDRSVYKVTVRSKFEDETGDGSPVCGPIDWSPAQGLFTATDKRLPPGSVWEIEVLASPSTKAFRISIEKLPAEGEPSNGTSFSSLGAAVALSCDEWSGDPIRHQSRGFAGRLRLDIMSTPIDADVDAEQRKAVLSSLLDSAALWVSACRECRREHLVAIAADDVLYIRSQLARWLSLPATYNPRKAEEELVSGLENRVFLKAGAPDQAMPATKGLESYVLAEAHLDAIHKFCSGTPDKSITPTIASVHAALCRPDNLDKRARAKISVRFTSDGSTYCGKDSEIIACRADLTLTEFNSLDFRFRLMNMAKPIGRGAVELDFLPVLVHEMGHWIGLGHIDEGKSIMASSHERARCIDEGTISELMRNVETTAVRPEAFRLHNRT